MISKEYTTLKEFDEINALKTAEQKGLEKGIEKGMQEEKMNIAKSLLDVLDVETIALKTGLSVDTIEKLREM